MMLLADNPAESLQVYRKAFALSSELSAADALNIHHRSSVADALLGIGLALHRLGKREEAIQNLGRAIELQKSIEAVAPERIFLLRTTSRAYMEIGNVWLDSGEYQRALDNYREGLATAERSLQRASSSLNHALDRADLLEAIGRYYLKLARRPGIYSGTPSRIEGRSPIVPSKGPRDLAGLDPAQSGSSLCCPSGNAGCQLHCFVRSALRIIRSHWRFKTRIPGIAGPHVPHPSLGLGET